MKTFNAVALLLLSANALDNFTATQAAPEPGALSLLAVGSACACAALRKRVRP